MKLNQVEFIYNLFIIKSAKTIAFFQRICYNNYSRKEKTTYILQFN